jgi:lysyl-tRNA synthetase class 2
VLRPAGGVAVDDAPRPRHAERPDRVPGLQAVELLRERGLEEMSLNFATAARYMHARNRIARALVGRLCRSRLEPYFQIESLYRFNAKFFPRWEPRYSRLRGRLGLPRASVAAMWAEGQLPKPTLPRPNFPRRRPVAPRAITG